MYKKSIIWFHKDLRLHDNPALYHAIKDSTSILPIYIDDIAQEKPEGAASKWWLYHSLKSLKNSFQEKFKISFHCYKGKSEKIILDLVKRHEIEAVYWNDSFIPDFLKKRENIEKKLKDQNISVYHYNASLLHHPKDIKNKQGSHFKVFSPFWKHIKKLDIRSTVSLPQSTKGTHDASSCDIDDLDLLPKIHWDKTFYDYWEVGEKAAQEKLESFIEHHINAYKKQRDYPAKEGTSKLSPHLHFGEISPVQIFHKVELFRQNHHLSDTNTDTFLSEVAWREFSYHLLYHYPCLPSVSLQDKFKNFPWRKNYEKDLKAWKEGKTGYPIVDAAMRQLWKMGWMHNRLRMIVGSFLVKDLLIPWQEGEAHFWECLVDGDHANNTASWQWVAGCGADAAPYFRVFNPYLQSKKFDPKGEFIRQWVPELKNMSDDHIHEPYKASEDSIKKADIKNYPEPIIDHYEARDKALEIFKKLPS